MDGGYGERGARAYNGGLGRTPQRGPGQIPLLGGQGQSPPEAESFLAFGRQMEVAQFSSPYSAYVNCCLWESSTRGRTEREGRSRLAPRP